MLSKMALGIHSRISGSGVEAPSVAVIVYALKILLNVVSIFGLSVIIGAVTGELSRTIVMLLVFAAIRFVSGGYHIRSEIGCITASTALMTIVPHIHLTPIWTYVLTGIAFVMMAVFAPANYDRHARIEERHYPKMKWIAAGIVAINFIAVQDILALAFLAQAMTLPFKEGGESHEKTGI